MIRNLSKFRLTLTLLILAPVLCQADPAGAQVPFDPADPLDGDRMLLPSYEIMALRADPILLPRLYDATGGDASNGVERTVVFDPDQVSISPGNGFDGVAADFDGDGVDEFAYAYESGGRARVRIIETNEGPNGTVSARYDALFAMGGPAYERQIGLVAGNMDADPEVELVLVYQTSSDSTYVEFLEVDVTTLEATRFSTASVYNTVTGNFNCNTISGPVRSRFDVVMSDLDGDQLDEVVLANLVHHCDTISSSAVLLNRWKAVPGGIASGGLSSVLYHSFHYTDPDNFYDALAITVGDFDGGQANKQIAVVGKTIFNNTRKLWGTFVEVTPSDALGTVFPVNQNFETNHPGPQRDDRLDIEAFDLDLDGRAELISLEGHRLLLHKMSASNNLVRDVTAVATIGAVTAANDSGRGRLVVADLDSSASETFMPEIGVANSTALTLEILRPEKDPSGTWSFAAIASAPLASEVSSALTLTALNVDNDGVYLGEPRVELREEVFQPIVILNAPPVHFDVVDGQLYDVNGCWDPDADACQHEAIYTATSAEETQVETEVRADWSVSSELRLSAGLSLGFVESSLEATFENQFGEGFSRTESVSDFVSVSLGATAALDDQVFGTETDYTVFEYPIYAYPDAAESITHVVAVVPGAVTSRWRTLKSVTDFGVLQNHEPGNLLSYSASPEPIDNAMLAVELDFGNLSPQLQISENSFYTWFLDFVSVVANAGTHSSQQSVSAGVDADFGGGAFGFTASIGSSVEGIYGSSGLSTHTTIATQETMLDVTLANITSNLPVGGVQTTSDWATYDVTVYAYWSHSGALVVDYGVDLPPGASSFWTALYGEPDLTWSMPWRNDAAKQGLPNEVLYAERTRDLLAFPKLPEVGERVTIQARVQNYSLAPTALPVVSFYLGDTSGPIGFLGIGRFDPGLTEIPARGDAIVSLEDFAPPSGIDADTRIYAVIHANGEMRTDNNQAWNFAGFRSLPSCANGLDDDGDGDIDSEDDECLGGGAMHEVPEPGFGQAIAVCAIAVCAMRRPPLTRARRARRVRRV